MDLTDRLGIGKGLHAETSEDLSDEKVKTVSVSTHGLSIFKSH